MQLFTGPIEANTFHTDSTCPHCQEHISEGQLIVKCVTCGSLHHEDCWKARGRCGSYHCAAQAHLDPEGMQPEIRIGAEELEHVTPPPPRIVMPSQGSVEDLLPKRPTKVSKLGLLSLVLALLALGGVLGAINGNLLFLGGGIALSVMAVIVGVVAMVLIMSRKKAYGLVVSGLAIIFAGVLTITYLVFLDLVIRADRTATAMNLNISKGMPTETEFERMEPSKAKALRANVVLIVDSPGMFSYGRISASGVVTKTGDKRVFILTNKHVVGDPGQDIDVLFYNGERSRGVVEWRAPGKIDLAIISCQALTLKDPIQIEIHGEVISAGEPVFAVGNPMELYWSYTEGVISSVRRQSDAAKELTIYQTQTPINCGNSGGGLYDMNGRLIGVNTWTQNKAVAEGLSFAISTKTILELLSPVNQERFFESPAVPDTAPVPPAGKDDPVL